MASPGCSWCRLTSSGSSLSSPHCDSVKSCYWGITGKNLQDVNTEYEASSTTDTPTDGGLSVTTLSSIVVGGVVGLLIFCVIICVVVKNKHVAVAPATVSSRPPFLILDCPPPEVRQPNIIPYSLAPEPSAPTGNELYGNYAPINRYVALPEDQSPPAYSTLYPGLDKN